MNILFYYPSNNRTVSIESVIISFHNQNHRVSLLTQSPKAEIHEELEKNNISTYAYEIKKNNSILYYMKHFLYLIQYCRKNNIDIVYSHLHPASIVSVFAQFFCKSRFYICRHHSNVNGMDKNFNQTLFDAIINRLAKVIIVPSIRVYEQVTIVEKVKSKKVKLINYGYDFSKYDEPDVKEVENIRTKYSAKLLLVCVARLVPGKRFEILFKVVNELIKFQHLDIKLLVISDGPQMNDFKQYILRENLTDYIFLLGSKNNVIDYLAAADAVPLLSEAEASNNVIKEAGLVNKCVLVCDGVGDFNDYIVNNYSGLFLNKLNPETDLKLCIKKIYDEEIDKKMLGENLYNSVIKTFSIENVISQYSSLNSYN